MAGNKAEALAAHQDGKALTAWIKQAGCARSTASQWADLVQCAFVRRSTQLPAGRKLAEWPRCGNSQRLSPPAGPGPETECHRGEPGYPRRPSPPLGAVLGRRNGNPWSCCSAGWLVCARPLSWVPPLSTKETPCCLGSAPALTPLAVVASRPVAWGAISGSCARPRPLLSARVCGEQGPLKSTCLGAAGTGWSGGQGLVPGNAMQTA